MHNFSGKMHIAKTLVALNLLQNWATKLHKLKSVLVVGGGG